MRNSTLKAITNASVRNTLVNAAINGTLDIEDDGAATNAVRDEDGKRVKVGDRICAVAFDGRELFVTSVGDDYVFARPVGGGREWELHDGEFTVCNSTNANNGSKKTFDEWAFEIRLREKFGDNGKGAEEYMSENRSAIERDLGKDGFRKLCSKFGNALAYNATATNGKFKVGDKVTDGEAVYLITDIDDAIYEWKVVKGASSTSKGGRVNWADARMTLVNNANTAVNYGTNPNYNPEEGMKFLAEHFDMFDPKVAQGMIRDAQRKGVAIPATVIAKAKRAGILNAGLKTRNHVVANALAWCGDGEMDAQTLTDLAIEAEKRGDVYEAARLKERAGELAKAMRRDDDANDNTFDIRVS